LSRSGTNIVMFDSVKRAASKQMAWHPQTAESPAGFHAAARKSLRMTTGRLSVLYETLRLRQLPSRSEEVASF
jgi:hypothetical protein